MGVQLKPGIFKSDFNLEEVSFEDIMIADANTRYRYTIAKISELKKIYMIQKNNKYIFYKDDESGCRVVNIWPDEQSCNYCKENDDFFKSGRVICLDDQTFYHNVLSEFHKKNIYISVYVNLDNSIELPARDFKIDWFEYLFYDMKEDWMFDY